MERQSGDPTVDIPRIAHLCMEEVERRALSEKG